MLREHEYQNETETKVSPSPVIPRRDGESVAGARADNVAALGV